MAFQPTALTFAELKKISRRRLRDAKALRPTKSYEAGFYLCGYAVEIALKARICKTLKWSAFPTNKKAYASFFVHDLDLLLTMSGREASVRSALLTDWSYVVDRWGPEVRYAPSGSMTKADLDQMILSTRAILGKLL